MDHYYFWATTGNNYGREASGRLLEQFGATTAIKGHYIGQLGTTAAKQPHLFTILQLEITTTALEHKKVTIFNNWEQRLLEQLSSYKQLRLRSGRRLEHTKVTILDNWDGSTTYGPPS